MKTHMKQIITDPNDPIWKVWPSEMVNPWKLLCGLEAQEYGTEKTSEVNCKECLKKMNPPDDAKKVAVERGPNYDWKHEAEHYRAECDRLRSLLYKVESQGERDAFERDALKQQNVTLVEQLATSQARCGKLERCINESYCVISERISDNHPLLPHLVEVLYGEPAADQDKGEMT